MTADTRDEVAAERFRRRRLRSALLQGDPDSPKTPLARLGAGVYGGLAVTVLLLAVAGIYGVLQPGGSTAWQERGAFVVDDAGARYVYRDGVLHPVLNYASARLLLGDDLHVVSVSTASLAPAVRGPMIGIPGAPDSLPDAAHIAGADWSVCAVGRAVDDQLLHTEIRPGMAAAGSAVPEDAGYLVRTETGRTFLIWSGHAHQVPEEWLEALHYHTADPIQVQESFVTALPAGEPLDPPEIAGLGEPGPALPASVQPTTIGTIYADRTNAFYVLTRDGLASLTPLQAQLLLADPAVNAAYPGSSPTPLKVSQAQVTEAAPKPLPAPAGPPLAAAPAQVPTLQALPPGEQQLCARYLGGADPDLAVGPAEASAGATSTGAVRLTAGTGSLIAQRSGAESTGSTVYLVTETGVRYPLSGQRAAEALGLAEAPVAQLPPELIAALPVGPTLDPATAAAPAS
jgi:type VII secretion protein EccB